jgi:hypothetical protein
MLAIILSASSMHSMKILFCEFDAQLWDFMQRKKRLEREEAIEAERYNQKNKLITLPDTLLKHVIAYAKPDKESTSQALLDNIKYYIQLKMVSKHFRHILTFKAIGTFCKEYDCAIKNDAFKQILKLMRRDIIKIRIPILSLSYSGAKGSMQNEYPTDHFFSNATKNGDQHLVKLLFRHGINPNAQWLRSPIFFYAKTCKIAKLFIDNGTDIQATSSLGKNVLWTVVTDGCMYGTREYSAELISFYINHGVDARAVCHKDKSCLLHALVETSRIYIRRSNNLLKKVALVLDAIPDMIDTINADGLTPLDVAEETLKAAKKSEYANAHVIKKIIALYRRYKARTAQEIAWSLLPRVECSLCFDKKVAGACYSMHGCINGLAGCNAIFCKTCLLEYIIIHLEEGSTLELKCPNIQCAKKMHESDIRVIIQDIKHNKIDLYQRFLDISFNEFIMQNGDVVKRCPTPDCRCTYEIDAAIAYRLKCPGCKRTYCSHCGIRHASEMTCKQAYEHAQRVGNKNEEQAANKEWLQDHTKACPRCKTVIEKNGGCFYMFCKKCGHEFCWKCLQPHDHSEKHPCGLWENDEEY